MDSSSPDPSADLRRDYDGDLRSLRAARRDVVEWMADLGADEESRERAALIVSELSSNAIQRSPGLTYRLCLVRVDHQHAEISVRNHLIGVLPPPRELWRPPGDLSLKELSLRGRGLAIVESMSDEVTIEHLGDELIVSARLRIGIDRK